MPIIGRAMQYKKKPAAVPDFDLPVIGQIGSLEPSISLSNAKAS